MTKKLLPHQIEQAEFLAYRLFAGNFSSMGTGKTLAALRAVEIDKPARVLIVAPPSATYMWQANIKEYLNYEANIITKMTIKSLPNRGAAITTYHYMQKYAETFINWLEAEDSVLIFDEAHALKTPASRRTKVALGENGLCMAATKTWLLTGTPMTRWNDDLFMFAWRAAPAKLAKIIGRRITYRTFNNHFCYSRKKRYGKAQVVEVCGNRNTEVLNRFLYEGDEAVAVRVELKEVIESMPPLNFTEHVIPITMTEELKAAERKALDGGKDYAAESGEDENLATLRRLVGEAKAPAGIEFINRLLEEEQYPLVIGAWHKSVLSQLTQWADDQKLVWDIITGDVSAKARHDIQEAFNEGKLTLLFGQIAAMGESLNLQTGGHRIVALEESFSPQAMHQFYGRLWRMGQTRSVFVDILRADIPVEHALAEISQRKRDEFFKLNNQNERNTL